MPRGALERSDVFASVLRALFGPICLLSLPRKRLYWYKKIVVPCLDVIMIAFFPRNIH